MTTVNDYTIKIHNTQTDEIIERKMTNEEIAQLKLNQEFIENMQLEIAEKAAARQAIADRLGLSADELTVLLG